MGFYVNKNLFNDYCFIYTHLSTFKFKSHSLSMVLYYRFLIACVFLWIRQVQCRSTKLKHYMWVLNYNIQMRRNIRHKVDNNIRFGNKQEREVALLRYNQISVCCLSHFTATNSFIEIFLSSLWCVFGYYKCIFPNVVTFYCSYNFY